MSAVSRVETIRVVVGDESKPHGIPVTAVAIATHTGIPESQILRAATNGRIPFHRGPDGALLFDMDDAEKIGRILRGGGPGGTAVQTIR